MNNYEQIIFDALASGRGINLPGVGSLRVEREAANLAAGDKVTPPYNYVVFSPEQDTSFESLTEGDGGTEYKEWLAGNTGAVMELSGVGILRGKEFMPSVELYDALNPYPPEPVALARRRSGAGRVLLFTGCAIVAAAVIFGAAMWIHGGFECLSNGHQRGGHSAVTEGTQGTQGAQSTQGTNAGAPEDVIQQGLEEYAATGAAGDIVAAANAGAQSGTVAGSPMHHLVVGVFSVPANADKLIAEDPLGIGSGSYSKVPFKAGQTMVSAFSSPDRVAVHKRRRELQRLNPDLIDLWVYTIK